MGCPAHPFSPADFVKCQDWPGNHFQTCQRGAEAQGGLWFATSYFKLNQPPGLVALLPLWAENGSFLEVGNKKAIQYAHSCHPAYRKGFKKAKACIWPLKNTRLRLSTHSTRTNQVGERWAGIFRFSAHLEQSWGTPTGCVWTKDF